MAMKKGAKVGLGIFMGIITVVVVLVVVASVMLFGGRGLTQGEYTAQEKQRVFEKLPVLGYLEQIDSSDGEIFFGQSEQNEFELQQGELNALLDANGIDVSGMLNSFGMGSDFGVEIKSTAAQIQDSQLVISIELGDCEGLTGNATIDNFLSGSVIKAYFATEGGELLVDKIVVNNITSDMIPAFILEMLPNYSGGGVEDYINDNYSHVVKTMVEKMFVAEEIYNIEISGTTLKISGKFYQIASVAE